jgi:hypothetical protein
MVKHRRSRISLQVLIVGDELDYTVPDFCSDMIAGSRDELQDGVNIPLVLPISSVHHGEYDWLTSVANLSVKIAIFKTISSLKL